MKSRVENMTFNNSVPAANSHTRFKHLNTNFLLYFQLVAPIQRCDVRLVRAALTGSLRVASRHQHYGLSLAVGN